MKISHAVLMLFVPISCFAREQALDFWDEGIRLFGTSEVGRGLESDLVARRQPGFRPRAFSLDHADHRVGDLSIAFSPAEAGMPGRFWLLAGLWGERWNLSRQDTLRLWVKAENAPASGAWNVRLVDETGREAGGQISGIGGEWKELDLPLSRFRAEPGFDWRKVQLCEFTGNVSKDTLIRVDGVRFEGGGRVVGVTDKTVAQRMAEAEASRTARVEWAFRQAAAENSSAGKPTVLAAFAKMMLNVDLETANRLLTEELRLSSDANTWSLLHTPLYCRFYYMFSNRVGKHPGRMTLETEKLLLETLWNRTAVKNDIFWARQSTWWLDGSENHDLNAKACNLVTSRIFMNEPEFKDRVYPDHGFGGSYHYGHAGYYGPGIDAETRHGGGRARLADGGEYKATDHYKAWLAFLKTYFRERARRGFFLEYGSPTYSKHTLNFVDLAFQYGGDAELHEMLQDFLTLYWAEWAQVSISGVRGGPKTRHHKTVGGREDQGTADLIGFHLGGRASAGPWSYWNLINDFVLHPIVWRMALDRQGMGTFVYRARGIGEEENVLPRPPGTERSLVVGTDARFLKYTYVTPDYTLGTQMDHPSAVHSHLSIPGRWHGMTFAQSPEARIVPVNLTKGINKYLEKSPYDMEAMYRSVQHGRTLIIQQSPRWYAVHPEWFPANVAYDQSVGIWFGKAWDRQMERDGWIFVQSGRAYAAVRPVLWDEAYEKAHKRETTGNQVFFNAPDDLPTVKLRTDGFRWSDDHSILLLDDNRTATIFEAGSTADHPTLEAFMADVLDNPIALYKTVVPGDNILVYTGSGADAREIVFSCAAPQIPTVGGQPVDYSLPMTFDSPYLKSEYKSGRVHLEYGGEVLELDFSGKEWTGIRRERRRR